MNYALTWWLHQMETFSALLAFCAGNSPVTGEFPAQRPVTRSFDVFFDLRPNQQMSKQWRRWWFETPSSSLWRHCNEFPLCCFVLCLDTVGFYPGSFRVISLTVGQSFSCPGPWTHGLVRVQLSKLLSQTIQKLTMWNKQLFHVWVIEYRSFMWFLIEVFKIQLHHRQYWWIGPRNCR